MARPVAVLATDLSPRHPAWTATLDQAAALQESVSRALGVTFCVDLAYLPAHDGNDPDKYALGQVIDRHAGSGAREIFVLPATLGLTLALRVAFGEQLAAARRRHTTASIHHDNVDLANPILVDCLAGQVLRDIVAAGLEPRQAGLLIIGDGQSDPVSRADSYRLMRLLWEQTGVDRAEIGFIRRAQPSLRDTLERCLAEPLGWLLLPQCQWESELCSSARSILEDCHRAHPETKEWRLLDPPQDHPAILAWLEQRLLRLWQDKRARQAARIPSIKQQTPPPRSEVWSGEAWVPAREAAIGACGGRVARARNSEALADILAQVLPQAERYLVKVTWHGYAPGTYTGPLALDLLLGALPGPAVLLEGHTSGRNLGDAEFDWVADAERHRTWVRQQDIEFLRRTGLAEVMARHGAQYLNITEAWWDGACVPAEDIRAEIGDGALRNPELAGFLPSALRELRGTPLISFARFKGPTRLSISNLFGMIPHPLRTSWHGPDITHFASVCCDLALIYETFFPLFGLVEGFDSAVRWNRNRLYRSRWGNYDLVLTDGLFTLSKGLLGADILASRMQGQDVLRSGFYDVVRDRLGWAEVEAEMELPSDVQASLA